MSIESDQASAISLEGPAPTPAALGRWPAGVATALGVGAVVLLVVWTAINGHGELIPWLVSCGCVVVSLRAPRRAEPVAGDLQRHLACARRRADPCDLLVVACEGAALGAVEALIPSLRTTDSAGRATIHASRACLGALLDDVGEGRFAVEERLSRVSDRELSFGWARFPEDGLTIDVLTAAARRDLGRADLAGSPLERSAS